MESQWPKATPYRSGISGMYRQEPISMRPLAMPFFKPTARVAQVPGGRTHQACSHSENLVDPLLVAAVAFVPRLIHPTTVTTANEYFQ